MANNGNLRGGSIHAMGNACKEDYVYIDVNRILDSCRDRDCFEDVRVYLPDFDAFYQTAFDNVKSVTYPDARAAECVRRLKEKGYTVAVATSPVFPEIATRKRLAWAGLNWEDFALVTTYDNSTFGKPHPAYYREVLEKIGKTAEECLMVGNDVDEDMSTSEMGMQVFLLHPWVLNRKNKPSDHFEQGDFDALLAKIDALPALN